MTVECAHMLQDSQFLDDVFGSGFLPSQLSCPKKFIFLTDPDRVCCKGVIFHGRHMSSGLPVIGQSYLIRKGYVVGCLSIHLEKVIVYT